MTRRLKASERKATILAVAKVLFADKGYHGVSVDEIASRLGVSPAILYRHFASKQAIYEAVLSDMACRRESYVEAVVQSDGSFEQVLRNIAQAYVASVAGNPDYLRMEMQSVLEGNQAARQFFENRWQPFLDYVEYSMRELASQGNVDCVNPRLASLLFQGMIREALYAKCILQSDRYRDFQLEDLVDYLIDLFFKAIGYRVLE